MFSHFKREIPFMRYRNLMIGISVLLMVASLMAIAVFGLKFGIEFQGGSSIDFNKTGTVTIEKIRETLEKNGEPNAVIQTSVNKGEAGFLVRTATTDPNLANERAHKVAQELGFEEGSYQVTTIGPDWGDDITKSSATAFLVALGLIIIYISIRFEFKMSFTAVASLIHDLIIVCGVYALSGREVTPNVIAALLTIMGYSLYDTVVVFHRINENANGIQDEKHKTFIAISNKSINEVFMRTINTTLTSLVPVVAMLLFGGETLKDFAFAMTIGLILGSYSSIGVASPLFALWKTREDKWKKLERKYGEKADTQTSTA